jgi:hypothetical protein
MLHSYVYYLTVTRYADETAIGGIKWFTVVSVILSSLVGTPVQVYICGLSVGDSG